MLRNRKFIAVAGVAAAVILSWGCGSFSSSSSDTGTSSDTTASPGTAAKPAGLPTVALGAAITVTSGGKTATVVATKVDKPTKANQFTPPKRGQFVAVSVQITATKGPTNIGPSNFRFVAADGTVYQAEFLVAGIDPQLDAMAEVAQGQKKEGKVVFDCDPAKIAGGKIQLSTDGEDIVGYWTF